MDYRTLDLETLNRADAYKLFISAIIPRPIGWVSTVSKEGIANAAPFSWFNAVCSDPFMVMLAIGRRRGEMKDTTRNIRDTSEFVVNLVSQAIAAQMVQTSADYPPEVSEFEVTGLTPLKSRSVKPDRIGESPIHIECRLEQMLPLGNHATDLIIGRCVYMHVDPSVLGEDGLVDAKKYQPIARLGRDEYALLGPIISYPRPVV